MNNPLTSQPLLQMAWARYNYRHNVDVTMGIMESMLQAMGPTEVSVSIGPADPNVDPDYSPVIGNGRPFDHTCLPPFIREVRGHDDDDYMIYLCELTQDHPLMPYELC